MFGEAWTVAGAAAFGSSYAAFKAEYFKPVDFEGYVWRLKSRRHEEAIHARLKPWALYLKVPKKKAPTVVPIRVLLPPAARRVYNDLATSMVAELNGRDILALGELAVSAKIRQICSGAIYVETGSDEWEAVHTEKLDALEDLIEELEGEPLMVIYEFKHELERLRKRFPGRVHTLKEKGATDAWNAREIPILALHPKSGGHGLNLQFGGSTIAFLTTPWSLELYWQVVGRLWNRPGQTEQVTVYQIVADDSIDEKVAKALIEHQHVEDRLLASAALP
jgi:SNF2 family DNA or RNA helicase